MNPFNIADIGNPIKYGFYAICIMLDSFIYALISSLFKIFMALASARLLTSDAYTTIANKIYMIIGVVMLFVLAYGLLRAIIDPDQSTKGDFASPKIIKSILVAVIGLAVTPVVFNLMYKAQSVFIENDVIAAIFFRSDQDSLPVGTVHVPNPTSNSDTGAATNAGSTIDVEVGDVEYNKEIKNLGGSITATSIWQAFFRPNPAVYTENYDEAANLIEGDLSKIYATGAVGWTVGCAIGAVVGIVGWAAGFISFGAGAVIGTVAATALCGVGIASNASKAVSFSGTNIKLSEAYNYSSATGDFTIYQGFIPNICEKDNNNEVLYNWFITAIVGIFVCYCFLSFSIDMAVRAAKLAYYQIIAPIPLILQIIPKFKQDVWKKYVNSVITTFLEVFIRISVVYIVVYFICHLGDIFSFGNAFNGVDLNPGEWLLATVILILGLITFARQAPKLIADTFNLKSGSLSLGIRKKLAEGGAFTAGAYVQSTLGSGIKNFRDKRANGKGFMRSLGSGIAGVASSNARFIGNRLQNGNIKSAQEMRSEAKDNIKNVEDARTRRQRNADRYHTEGRNAVTGRLHDARDAISRWSGGSVDTSYEDGLTNLYSTMESLKDTARGVTAKNSLVQAAQMVYDTVMKETISEYDDETYALAVNAAMEDVDDEWAKNGTSGKYKSEADYIRARADAGAAVRRENFKLSKEKISELQGKLRVKQQAAKKNLEVAQDTAFSNMLAAGDEKAYSVLESFLASNSSALKKYSTVKVKVKDSTGAYTHVSMADFLKQNMGIDIENGMIDTNTHQFSGHADANVMTVKVGGVKHDFKYEFDAKGNLTKIVDVDGVINAGKNDYTSAEAETVMNWVAANSTNPDIDTKDNVYSNTYDAAKKTRNDFIRSADYINKKNRQRAAEDSKNK